MNTRDIVQDKIKDIPKSPFGDNEEAAIISLMLDHPEFFATLTKYINPNSFTRDDAKYAVAIVMDYHEKYGIYPTRGMVLDIAMRELTVDHIDSDEILALINRKSDPREIPAIKDRLLDYAKCRAWEKVFHPTTSERWRKGDLEYVNEVINEANNIREINRNGLWFFDDLEKLYVSDDSERFTTGIAALDRMFGDGGPARKEMMVVMAPTGRGKSIFLVNIAIANVLCGRNVLIVTLELSDVKTGIRGVGAMTNLNINERLNPERIKDGKTMKELQIEKVSALKQSSGDLAIYEFPPDEITVDDIIALIDELKKTKGWIPDVVVVDYLELMTSNRSADNNDSYTRQKACSTQLRGLAQKENVVVFTATQTNRAGNDDTATIDVTKIAESYGKAMAIDYLVSINQTDQEHNEKPQSQARLYVAKNRNGEDRKTIPISINYNTMKIKEMTN